MILNKFINFFKQIIKELTQESGEDEKIDITKLYNNITNLKHKNDRFLNPIKEEDE